LAATGDQALRHQLRRFALTLLLSAILLTVGAALGPPWQVALWVAALVADLGGNLAIGASGWRIRSPGHFSERHGLIVIIALGESIVSIGIGVTDLPISWPIVAAAAVGIILAGAMWWLYFDAIVLVAEDALARAAPSEVARLGRDAFTYWHLPMVAGSDSRRRSSTSEEPRVIPGPTR
jgi:low temperature requirement protein LtrA